MRRLPLAWLISILVLALGLVTPEDAGASKIYWTDAGTGKIQRANLDGTSVEDLVTTGLSDPVGIALDLSTPPVIPVLSVWGTLLLGSGLLALAAARRRAL